MCKKCGDIFNLNLTLKKCTCGETSGMYEDVKNAIISGDCVTIGINNDSFVMAYKMQQLENASQKETTCCTEGVNFEAFFIPEYAKSIKRI